MNHSIKNFTVFIFNSTYIENLWLFSFKCTTAAFLFPDEFNNLSLCVLPLLQISTPGGVREIDWCRLCSCFSDFASDL